MVHRAGLRSEIYLSVWGLSQGFEKLKVIMAQLLFAFPYSGDEVPWY